MLFYCFFMVLRSGTIGFELPTMSAFERWVQDSFSIFFHKIDFFYTFGSWGTPGSPPGAPGIPGIDSRLILKNVNFQIFYKISDDNQYLAYKPTLGGSNHGFDTAELQILSWSFDWCDWGLCMSDRMLSGAWRRPATSIWGDQCWRDASADGILGPQASYIKGTIVKTYQHLEDLTRHGPEAQQISDTCSCITWRGEARILAFSNFNEVLASISRTFANF